MKLNEKIFYCRRKAGLSQEALAEALGVSRQAVSKWETGDAVPEIGKLLSLAKKFEVTTDWLLSEEEPEEISYNTSYYQEEAGDAFRTENSREQDTTTSAERFEKAADDWMERIPGVFGKLVRKFGWLAGVYVAAGGAGFTALGLIAKIMVNGMVNGFKSTTDSMLGDFQGFGGSAAIFYDENGNQLSAAESAELVEIFGGSGGSFFSSGSGFMGNATNEMASMMQNSPVSILANIMIIGGLIALIGGTVLAVLWYKKSKEQN